MTRVKVEHGAVPSATVATNAIPLGNLAIANTGNVQGAGAMVSGGSITPGPSTLQNTQLFGTTIDCYEDVFKEITKKLSCSWDETGGIAISDILDPSSAVATAQPIVYDTSDLFRQDVTTNAPTAAAFTANNGGNGGLAIITGQGTTGIPAGAIVVQRRMHDDKGRIWTIEGLPQNGEQIAFTTLAAPSSSVALQQVQVPMETQPPTLMDPIQPPPVQPQPEQASTSTTEERWFESEETLSWTQSKIGRYNPAQKVFRCVDCDFIGFLSRVAEHWLGNHADYRVFQCPRCPYTSAWARCVRMHLTRQHGETLADNSLWKENPVLEEVTKYLNTLKTKVEQKMSESASGEKRYSCPYCPYQTDRRDLYNRHENIHRDDKPFQCYVCDKQFNRADHVKKHFLRMHREHTYDINKIRKSSAKLNLQFANGRKVTSKQRKGIQSQSQVQAQQPLLVGAAQLDPTMGNETMTKQNVEQNLGLPMGQDILTVPVQTQSTNQTANVPHIAYFNPPPAPGQSGPLQGIPGVGGTKKEGKTKGHKKKKSGEKMYTCSYCPWQGVDNWCLKRHLNTHIKPFLCALCDYKAARSERLATHVLKVHNKRVCHKCSFLADDSESLSLHIQDSHQNPLVKTGFHCNICQEYFELRADLEAHAILEHQKVIVQCDLCDYRTTDELSMETHLRDKHNLTPGSGAVAAAAAAAAAAAIGQQINPPFAQTQVQNQLQLEPSENLMTQAGGGAILQTNAMTGPSTAVLGSFPSEPTVAQFSQSFDESEAEPDEPDTLCDKCGIDFLDEQSRKLHEKRHELVNPAEDEAVKGAKDATTKRFHRSYVCSTCSYTSSTKKLMMQHQRAHTGFELMCKAENCMFITPFDNTLKEHIQNDHGAEEHVRCPHCGLRMPSCNAFTTHWRFHHQSVCSLCVNVYRVKYDVKENEIHEVICKVSVPMSAISVASISDLESSLFFKMDSIDFPSLSLGDHDLVGLMGDPMEDPPPLIKRQKLDLPPQTSSIATLYRRESIKFLPRLVEVTVTPQPPKLKKMYSSKRKRRRQRAKRQKLLGEHDNSLAVTPSTSKSATNSTLNKFLQLMMKHEADLGVEVARVSPRRRYCQRGTFKWLFRNPREGYRCFSPLCEDRSSWRYPRRSGLALHRLWYHRITRFKCDICGLQFSHLYRAYLHKINQHTDASGMMVHDNVSALFSHHHPHIHSMNQANFSLPGQSHILS